MKNSNYLVWVDLEMTGLNSEQDHIMEIATVISDINLKIVETGPEIAIFQDEKNLATMNDWCRNQHKHSGLLDRVRKTTISL